MEITMPRSYQSSWLVEVVARFVAAECSTTRQDPNRQMCRLYLSMMEKMGLKLDKFGDATEKLDI